MSLSLFKKYIQEHTQLNEQHFNILSKDIKTSKLNKNTILLRPGEICENSFFVSKGLLRMYATDTQGKEHIIQFAPENWIVGDRSSTYFNQPSEYYIDCVENSEIVYISRDFVNNLSDMDTTSRSYFDSLLHNHIRHLQRRISLLLCATAEQRYMGFIALYPNLILRVPQWMIASYLGITPESLSRVRKDLATKNFKL